MGKLHHAHATRKLRRSWKAADRIWHPSLLRRFSPKDKSLPVRDRRRVDTTYCDNKGETQ